MQMIISQKYVFLFLSRQSFSFQVLFTSFQMSDEDNIKIFNKSEKSCLNFPLQILLPKQVFG